MDPKLAQEIITDAALLAQKSAELQTSNSTLEKRAGDLAADVARLSKEASDRTDKIVKEAEQMLTPMVERGTVSQAKFASAIELIRNDPAQVVAVLAKIASDATAVQLGGPGEQIAVESSDPITKFAMGT